MNGGGALACAAVLVCLLSACSPGGGTFVEAIPIVRGADSPDAPAYEAEMGERDFCRAFGEQLAKAKLNKRPENEQSENEPVYGLDAYGIQPTDRVLGWRLHIGLSGEEIQSISITMPLEPLKPEREAPKGDAAALESVRAYNETLAAERALFMDTVGAALRAANQHKRLFQESELLLLLSNTEKTVKKGSEKSQKFPGAVARSFILDISETAKIVFTLDFSL